MPLLQSRNQMHAPAVKTELMVNSNLQALDQMAYTEWEEPLLTWDEDEPPLLPTAITTPTPLAA